MVGAVATTPPLRSERSAFRALRPIAVPLLFTLALVPALAPLLADGVPATHDGHLHLQRTAALSRLAEDGVWFSRWLPDFAYGYGMPLFNYYAPLVYAPLLGLHAAGASLMLSYKLTAALALAISALSAFMLARTTCGIVASATAALVYAYAPYQLVNLYVRGALAESLAMALAPLVCWTVVQMRGFIHTKWVVATALSYGCLVLTHNVTALLLTPCLVLLALILGWQGERRLQFFAAAGFGIAGGLGLSAWFWLPAILERELVRIGAMLEPELFASFLLHEWPPFQTGFAYDFRSPVSDALDTSIYWPRIGLIQVVLTLCAAPLALLRQGSARALATWSIATTLAGLALQSVAAAPLYDVVPLLGFIQFPWRLLTVVALGSALLIGSGLEQIPRVRSLRIVACLIVFSLVAWTATARLAPTFEYPEDRFLTAEGQLRLEAADFGLGSTHSGEYLPVTSGLRNATRLRRELMDADSPESSRQRSRPPSGLEIRTYSGGPLSHDLVVEARQPDRLILRQFYFPGWSARVDGELAPLRAEGALGQIALDVPAGVHTVSVHFDWTPLRLGALALSAAILGLIVAATALRLSTNLAFARSRRARLVTVSGTVGVLLVGCALSRGLDDRSPVSAELQSPVAAHESLALLGARVRDEQLHSGGPLAIEADWFVTGTLPRRLDMIASVRTEGGAEHEASWAYAQLLGAIDPGTVFRTQTNLRLPTDFPSGPATVTLRLAENQATVQPITVGHLHVPVRPEQRPPSGSQIRPVDGLTFNRVELRYGGRPTAAALRPGDVLDVEIEVGVERLQARDILAVLELRGEASLARFDAYTLGSWYLPPTAWQAGDRFRQELRQVVSGDLRPGRYAARLLLFQGGGPWSGLAPFSRFAPTLRDPPIGSVDLGQVDIWR